MDATFMAAVSAMSGEVPNEKSLAQMLEESGESKSFFVRANELYEFAEKPAEEFEEGHHRSDRGKLSDLRACAIFYMLSIIQDTSKCSDSGKESDIKKYYQQYKDNRIDMIELLRTAAGYTNGAPALLFEKVKGAKEVDKVVSDKDPYLHISAQWIQLYEDIISDVKKLRDKM